MAGEPSRTKKRKERGVTIEEIPSEVEQPELALVARTPQPAAVEVEIVEVHSELLPSQFERLSLVINPSYQQRLIEANELGFERPPDQRILDARFYTIRIDNFRQALSNVLISYAVEKYLDQGVLTTAQINAELNTMVPLCVNACMSALYSKLRNIHKAYGVYAGRFTAPPSYNRDIELPLPFADAIQNFGVFETKCMTHNYLIVPVYPEGTRYEGRSTEDWHAYKYESYIPILKKLGIPVRSVDTRVKLGSAWWTYRVSLSNMTYDFNCIFPPIHYSDNSTVTASMFLLIDQDNHGEPMPLIDFQNDDGDYGVRLRDVPIGIQLRCFAALCNAPREEWDAGPSYV
ncbi:ORF1 [Lomandra cryptic virus 1]|nr:ORF1 [Lomandra cryptic virus 1]